MKDKIIMIFSLLLVLATAVSVLSVPIAALDWDGDSGEGGNPSLAAGPNGYAIASGTWENCVAYRFSLVDKNGVNKVSKVIDVFRDSHFGRHGYASYKFAGKYNKKQLIARQNSGFSTTLNYTNCYQEKNYGFATPLPDPAGMEEWQNNVNNLNMVLSLLGAGSIRNLKNGDKILVEPVFDVRLESVWHAVSVTEIALYGKHILGPDSNGGASYNSESWGFIANFVNRYYPNSLFTPDGQGLWEGVSESPVKIKFRDIINKGYGVGIAYTETKSDFNPILSVKECRAYKGIKPSKTYHYGTSTGNAWEYWTTEKNYPCYGDQIFFSINFPKETENCYVKQTVWIDGTQVDARTGYSNDLEWFDVAAGVTTVPASKAYYTVKARVDWIGSDGTTKKYGVEKIFYIPVKPIATREKVTAFNEQGQAQASSTGSQTVGKLYFGQKVTFQYLYGATTGWEAGHTVRAKAYRYNGSVWKTNYSGNSTGEDVIEYNIPLSSAKSYKRNSSIGSYVIPLNANEQVNSYRLYFELKTAWSKDETYTLGTKGFYLPIVKSDVAIVDLKLTDGSGRYVDRDNLTVGETYTVRYVYRNNTDCTVFVKGYRDDKTQIPGVFAVPANGTIEVYGGTHTVPNEREYTLWGGVYLSTVARGNTDYESDGTNNEKLFTCRTSPTLGITAIAPNAPYRETTQVISTFRVWNYGGGDILPDDGVTVSFKVYKPGATTPFFSDSKNVVIPAAGTNIVYFKWNVPTGMSGGSVRVEAEIFKEEKSVGAVSDSRQTIPYLVYTTPDTQYEENAPEGFVSPGPSISIPGGAEWNEYEYDGEGGLRLRAYSVNLLDSIPNVITPATGETHYQKNGYWYMKSGYGISVQSRIDFDSKNGTPGTEEFTEATAEMYTLPQYAYVLYPEYRYAFGEGTSSTLVRTEDGGYSFFELQNYLEYGRVHFTPLWYPDGNYTVKIVQSDCWTPAGMIKQTIVPQAIRIAGSAYDDWYAGRR